MVRGIIFFLIVWLIVSAVFYLYIHLGRREKTNVLHTLLFGLATAIFTLAMVLLMVYLF